ncbi:hypothetical protein DIPPA_00391 [Diplonema papillatum]|nr:hypothetical protein DIPPA_00391 [Diplonema papillatum]
MFFPPAGTGDPAAHAADDHNDEAGSSEDDDESCDEEGSEHDGDEDESGDGEENEPNEVACEDENDDIGVGSLCEAAIGALDKVGDDVSSNNRAREADNDGIDNDGESSKKTARERGGGQSGQW